MYLRAMEAPIMVRVTDTSSAKGKSSGSRSNVLEGCTRVRYRSRPRASAKQVDSRFAGELSMPARAQVPLVNTQRKVSKGRLVSAKGRPGTAENCCPCWRQ